MKRDYTHRICAGIFIMLFTLLAPLGVSAQNRTVTGVVTDPNNEPVAGATVIVTQTNTGAITGANGEYSINAPSDGTLLFQFMGCVPQQIPVEGRSVIDVVLQFDQTMLDDVVVVGYGTQRRGSITGAVASVKGADMIQTKNENPQNMLTGRLPGVRVWQKSAEPGSFNANFDIRGLGAPLVIIDGIPRSVSDFQRLNAVDIEDVSVLKDAAAAIYGSRSANGVLLVTTKKGREGKTRVTYNGSFTFQKPSKMPTLTNEYDAMMLWNEKEMNNIDGGSIPFPESVVEEFRNGTRQAADWTSLIFSNWSPQTQHDLSISGGTDRIQYYVGLGYSFQEGFFKSGDLNYNKFNLRSNISAEIIKGMKFNLNLSGVADQQNNPYSSSVDIIRNYWRQGVLSPAYADPEQTMLSYVGLQDYENTVAMMTSDISGFRKYNKKMFQSSAELSYDFGALTSALKGLSIKGLASFDYALDNNSIYRKEYNLYAYNSATEEYNSMLYSLSSPNRMERQFYDKQQMLGQIMINYDRTFAEKHQVSALVGWEVQKNKGDNFYALSNLAFAMPYLFAANDGQMGGMTTSGLDEHALGALIGRVNYGYDNRYLIEAQFRYDGSSQLAPGYQWHFFPSASIGWRISEEPFFKNAAGASFINQLKLRASYGTLGHLGSLDYNWMTGYDYPAFNNKDNDPAYQKDGFYNHWAPGYIIDGQYTPGMAPMALPNIGITWAMSTTFNIGVDFEAWNGMLGVSFDYFDRRRKNLLARAGGELPTVVGAVAPLENLNSDRHLGLELELSHRNKVGDFAYGIKLMGTIVRNMYLTAAQNGPYGNSYRKWRDDNLNNRFQGVQFGYEGAGRYTSWEDIWTYPIYKDRDVLPGDYKYVDWNGDGEINGLDEHPFAFDQTPWLNYSLSFDASYKNFDFSLLFQGSALGSMEYKEPLYEIWGWKNGGGGTLTQYLDRWHPAEEGAYPWDQSIEWVEGHYAYTGRLPKGNSEFNRVSTAYLRLKSLELGYTIPKIKSLSDLDLRVFFNAYNLFTITKVKFVDPEHPDDDLGRLYPLNRTFTLGLSLSF